MDRVPNSHQRTRDFIALATHVADMSGLRVRFEPYVFGFGVQITWLERRRDSRIDLDRFLNEITSLADQDRMGLQLALGNSDLEFKSVFERFGFKTMEDGIRLHMERQPRQDGVEQHELDFEPALESAPPGEKAERFIKHNKAKFRKRYGKKWKNYLYGTAWKQFGESRTCFRDYLMLIESQHRA